MFYYPRVINNMKPRISNVTKYKMEKNKQNNAKQHFINDKNDICKSCSGAELFGVEMDPHSEYNLCKECYKIYVYKIENDSCEICNKKFLPFFRNPSCYYLNKCVECFK